jgi:tetratricopeptide (TPR) repeat protein
VNLLKEEKNDEALQLLRRSLKLAENNDHGLAMTYNNLACYYRKLGHLRSALIHLEKAMEIE